MNYLQHQQLGVATDLDQSNNPVNPKSKLIQTGKSANLMSSDLISDFTFENPIRSNPPDYLVCFIFIF